MIRHPSLALAVILTGIAPSICLAQKKDMPVERLPVQTRDDVPPKAKPIVTAALIRRACLYAMNPDLAANNATVRDRLRTFCALQSPVVEEAKWLSLKSSDVPDLDALRTAADALSDTHFRQLTTKPPSWEFTGTKTGGGGTTEALGTTLDAPQLAISNAIWGLSNFLVDRAREQFHATVLSSVGRRVCTPDRALDLMQSTCKLLRPVDDVGSSATMGPAIFRAAVRSDLRSLPSNAATYLIRNDIGWATDSALTDAIHVLRFAGFAVADIANGQSALAAMARLSTLDPRVSKGNLFSIKMTPAAFRLYTTSVALSSFDPEESAWKEKFPDWNFVVLYATKAALVNAVHERPYQWFDAPVQGDTLCNALPCGAIIGSYRRIQVVTRDAKKVEELKEAIAAATTDVARAQAIAEVAQAGVRMMRSAADPSDQSSFLRVDAVITSLSVIAKDLAIEDFASAANHTLRLVDTLGIKVNLPKGVARLTSFAADVAQAKDADAVETALDHFVGRTTYLTKRAPETGLYGFVNAYAGGLYGSERTCEGYKNCGEREGVTGAYVPIGVELGHSLNLPGKWRHIGTVAGYLQVADLGTLASFRLAGNDTLGTAPVVSFRQIFSPGISVLVGLKTVPVVAGFTFWSFAPSLRKITKEGVTEERNAVRRNVFFLAMDIPIFP